MSLANYSDLKTAFGTWLNRSGDSLITNNAGDFVTLCESRLNFGGGEPGEQFYTPPLRVRQMEGRFTATPTDEYLALPTDFMEMREIKVNTNPETHLTYVTPQQFAEAASSQDSGTPRVYTIVGDAFRLGPNPTADLTVELDYYQKIPALSDSNTTNWLLTACPNAYLYGSLLEAAILIPLPETDTLRFFALFQAAVKGFQRQDRMARHGAAALIMRPVTPTP